MPLDPAGLPPAFAPFATALIGRPDARRALLGLIQTLGERAGGAATWEFACALRAAWPGDPEVEAVLSTCLADRLPPYHLRMIADSTRNAAYAAGIARSLRPGMTVLEIGTGSGLLAMLAARAGAAHVWTVEENAMMAAIARDAIAANGLADRITVIEGLSTRMAVGRELPVRAEALVHEVYGPALLNEHVTDILDHARAELLAPGALMLPERAWIDGLIEGRDRLEPLGPFDDVEGIDLRLLDALRRDWATLGRGPALAPLSPAVRLREWDHRQDARGLWSETRVTIPVTGDGTARGVLQWLGFRFPDGTVHGNPPGTASHWALCYHALPVPVAVTAGGTLTLSVTQLPTRCRFEAV